MANDDSRAIAIPGGTPDQERIRALISLLLSSDLVRNRAIPLNHAPEALSRSPAKREILVHALLVFIERGVEPVTVQDLLDAANISRRTFYKHFKNKIDVLESLYKLSIDLMVMRYKADVGRASTVEEAAQHMVDVAFAYHKDLSPVIRMMQEESIRQGSPLAPHRAMGMQMVVALINDELLRIAGVRLDPLAIHALMWGVESMSVELLRFGQPEDRLIFHSRQVAEDMVVATFERAVARAKTDAREISA